MLDNSIVNLSCLEEYTNGDPEAIKELLEMFFETAEESLEKLESNIIDGKNDYWSSAGHKLKGAAAYVGADTLKSLCAQAQNMNNATQLERNDIFKKIKIAYANVCIVLKEKNL